MCPPAATSVSFRELRPIVSSCAWGVVGACEFPAVAIGRAILVMIDCTTSLDRGGRLRFGEGTGQWQRQRRWCGRLWGEGTFGSFRRLVGKGTLATAMSSVAFGHVWVVDGAVVPKVGVPLGQNACHGSKGPWLEVSTSVTCSAQVLSVCP
jgi:hypothetical protein